jgi:hypothetical protein
MGPETRLAAMRCPGISGPIAARIISQYPTRSHPPVFLEAFALVEHHVAGAFIAASQQAAEFVS